MIKQTHYVDEETGEIYKSTNKYVDAQFDDERGYLFWNRKNCNKVFHDVDFPSEINDSELGKLFRLSHHVYSNTNLLAYRGNGGIKPYDFDKIAEVIGLSDKRAKQFLNKMIKHKIIAKSLVEVGTDMKIHYYLNPIYFFSSNRIPLSLYLIFQESLDAILPDWVKAKYNEIEKEIEE